MIEREERYEVDEYREGSYQLVYKQSPCIYLQFLEISI